MKPKHTKKLPAKVGKSKPRLRPKDPSEPWKPRTVLAQAHRRAYGKA